MAKRYDLPRIAPQEKPGLINSGFSEGAFWGNLLGSFTIPALVVLAGASASVAPVAVVAGLAAATLGGGLISSALKNNELKKEQQEGKVVKEPSFFNRGIYDGLMVNVVLSLGIGAAAVAGVIAAPLAGMLTLASGVVGIGAAVMGSFSRRSEMHKEVLQAEKQQVSQQMGHGHARGLSQEITADEMTLLNSRLREGGGRTDFAERARAEQQAAQLAQQGKA